MPRKVTRTLEELNDLLASGGLELAEEYDENSSYAKNRWLFTRCKQCGTEAHYRIQYIMDKSKTTEPVCRACFWRNWLRLDARFHRGVIPVFGKPKNPESIRTYVEQYGFELIDIIDFVDYGDCYDGVYLVRCKVCGKQTVEHSRDIPFRCSCQNHPDTSAHYAPAVTREIKRSDYSYEPKTKLTLDQARITPIADVPELMAAWDDEHDPRKVMVIESHSPYYHFKCSNGHHPYCTPYIYLENGCPACRNNATKGTGLFIADTSPELAAEWLQTKNGKWTPENIRQESTRTVWWKCLACGYEWQTTPKERSMRTGQCCPNCGKIMGSIAWLYPELASEWSDENPVTAWMVRPNTKLAFTPIWICSQNNDHKWSVQVAARIRGGGCPECIGSGKSRVELDHFQAALHTFGNARSGVRYFEPGFSNTWSVDITVQYGGRQIAIEYDGSYWHADKADIDTRKSQELLSAGFIVIRLREEGLISLGITSPEYAELTISPIKSEPKEVMNKVLSILDIMIIDKR